MLDRSNRYPYLCFMAKKKDTNELAKFIVDIATGETPAPDESTKNPAAVALGRLGGLKGGKARASKLTPEKRSVIAKNAAAKRWEKKKSEE
jgi:hypothetical protein